MSECGHCKALRATEAQVLRHSKTIDDLINLLKNAKEDGGLTQAQVEIFQRLVTRNEAVSAGPWPGEAKRPIAPVWEGVDQAVPEGDKTGRAFYIPEDELREIAADLVEGLTTEGGHHKQYYMEEALRRLVPGEFATCKRSWGWADGIPD